MNRSAWKKDNRGVSLVEIIVVIAIMAVLVGVTSYGLSLISGKPVDECAKKIEMVLNRNRTSSMGKQQAWVDFYMDGNKVTVQEHKITARNSQPDASPAPDQQFAISAHGVKVRFTYKDGSQSDLDSTHRRVSFRRDSGSLEGDPNYENKICTKIEVYRGDYASATYKRTIELDELTGKVTLK